MTDVYVILVTAPTDTEAATMARTLVEERLVACVNLLPALRSIYRWEGAVEEEGETLMILKSARERLGEVRDRVIELHPYDEPEFLALEVAEGSESYLNWVLAGTRRPERT